LTDATVTDVSGTTATTDDATVITLCQGDTTMVLLKEATLNDNGDGCAGVGNTVTYTFTVTNTGNTTINSIVLTDTLLGGDITNTLSSGDLDND
ncbi:DUF7507 domain-containing protein, partial [Lacinutrix chionoecetis]